MWSTRAIGEDRGIQFRLRDMSAVSMYVIVRLKQYQVSLQYTIVIYTFLTARVDRHEVLRSGASSCHFTCSEAQTRQGARCGCEVPRCVHGGTRQREDKRQRHRGHCKCPSPSNSSGATPRAALYMSSSTAFIAFYAMSTVLCLVLLCIPDIDSLSR